MKKISYLILTFLIISFTSLLVACTGEVTHKDEPTSGFIENSWCNNVILAQGENLFVEYPIYITNPSDYNLDVNLHSNEGSINISSINNVLINENKDFHQYKLSYNLQFPTNFNDIQKISNGSLNLNINKEKYSVDLGTSLVSILHNPDKGIEVEGGTLSIDRMETNEYEISYTLKNTTDDILTVTGIQLNKDDKFKIGEIKETQIAGKSSSTIKFILTIDPSIKNTRVQPKIIYKDKDGKNLETNLTTFIIADPIAESEIKSKHKIF